MDAATASLFRSSVLPRKTPDHGARSMFLTATRSSSIRQLRSQLNSFTMSLAAKTRRSFVVRAAASNDNASSGSEPIAPLHLESPAGQFLSQILVSHPHLVNAAVEQQLDQLQTDRDSQGQNKDSSSAPGTNIVLYRRIAELKENERRRTLEEILYALVVQKFMEANLSLVPSLSPSSDSSGRVDTWPAKVEKFERLHSPEMSEMIHNHLALILGNRVGDLTSIAQISKLRVGQVYAASVMYGYFLKRVDQRFQLEKTMKNLPGESYASKTTVDQAVSSHPEVGSFTGRVSAQGFGSEIKPSRLRAYVMSFDGETLQRYATVRSKEAFRIVEKHTEALFGKPEIAILQGTVDSSKDEQIKISFAGMKRLILEAVTFGSFLWDVESHVDARYNFVLN